VKIDCQLWAVAGFLCFKIALTAADKMDTLYTVVQNFDIQCVLITLINKKYVLLGKMSVADVFLDSEFKYFSRISLSPIPFTLYQTM
jgi:hypothetical protein